MACLQSQLNVYVGDINIMLPEYECMFIFLLFLVISRVAFSESLSSMINHIEYLLQYFELADLTTQLPTSTCYSIAMSHLKYIIVRVWPGQIPTYMQSKIISLVVLVLFVCFVLFCKLIVFLFSVRSANYLPK